MTSPSRIILAATLALFFSASHFLLLRWQRRRPSRSSTPKAIRAGTIVAGALGFVSILFALKIAPLLSTPAGLLRSDFLFPLWALWDRADAWWWLIPPIILFAAVTLAWKTGLLWSVADAAFLPATIGLAFSLWASLSLTNGGYPEGLTWPFERDADYYSDVQRFDSFSAIWSGYNSIQNELSLHGQTHPPGAVSLLYGLNKLMAGRLVAVCLATVFLSTLTLLPLLFWARSYMSDRASRMACFLWIFAPVVTLYGATCMDMIFATPLVLSAAIFTRGLNAQSAKPAQVATLSGVSLAVGFAFTFSAALLAVIFCLLGISQVYRRPEAWRRPAAIVGLTGATSVLTLFAVAGLTGFDWVTCLKTAILIDSAEGNVFLSWPYYLLTRLMGILDFLVLAGVAVSPIWIRLLRGGLGAVWNKKHFKDALNLDGARAAAVTCSFFLMAGAYKIGETGRIWLFLLPFVVLPVCRALEIESESQDDAFEHALWLLVAFGFCQSLLMEYFLDTRW